MVLQTEEVILVKMVRIWFDFLNFVGLGKTRISPWLQFTTWKHKALCWQDSVNTEWIEGAYMSLLTAMQDLRTHGVEALIDIKRFMGETFVLNKCVLEKKATAM